LAIDAKDSVEQLLLEGGHGVVGCRGQVEPGESGAAEVGGDAQGASSLGKGHFGEILVAEVFEEAFGDAEEFLSAAPFLIAEAVESSSPIGGLLELPFGESGGLLLEETGVEGEEAVGPVVFTGPVSNGGEPFAEFIGDCLM
jgi:hypothetical protein